MPDFHYVDVVRLGINAANARDPRLQKSAIAEFGEILSHEVTAGEWQQDGDSAVNSHGQDVEQYLNHLVSTRPHWEIPATVIDAADTTWLDGSLTAQGKRWRELRAFLGNDAATNAALAAEAALYGATVGSTKKGVKPGTIPADVSDKPDNPWSAAYAKRKGPQAAREEQLRIIATNTGLARSLAKSANVRIDGGPLLGRK
jgi:hypothetical protein